MQTDTVRPFYRDLSECPPNCEHRPRGSNPCAHRHCVSFGCPLLAEGGGGDDGLSVSGYVDAKGSAAVQCDTCGLDLCRNCVPRLGLAPRCYDCTWLRILEGLGMAS